MIRTLIKYWFPVVGWMAIIFIASADTHSLEHGSRVFGTVLHWLFPHVAPNTMQSMILVCRKCAHLAEYALLAVLLWRAFMVPERKVGQTWSPRAAIWTMIGIVVYAGSDEYHQTFVPTRQGTVIDVIIDSCGALTALLVIYALQTWWKPAFCAKRGE